MKTSHFRWKRKKIQVSFPDTSLLGLEVIGLTVRGYVYLSLLIYFPKTAYSSFDSESKVSATADSRAALIPPVAVVELVLNTLPDKEDQYGRESRLEIVNKTIRPRKGTELLEEQLPKA